MLKKAVHSSNEVELGLLLQDGIDIEKSQAYVSGMVDEHMHRRIYRILSLLNRAVPVKKGSQLPSIQLVFNTYGGSVDYALSIYDMIVGNKRPVDIVVAGPCKSAGTLIIQAARKRYSLPQSQFMIHFGHQSATTSVELSHYIKMHKEWVKTIANRCHIDEKQISKWHDTEHYMTPQQALAIGFIDDIVRSVR